MPVLMVQAASPRGGDQMRHALRDVDLDRRVAQCDVCGPTRFWLHHDGRRECVRGKVPLNGPRGSEHRIIEVTDNEQGVGVCAQCGPGKLKRRYDRTKASRAGTLVWRCATPAREHGRRSARKYHYGLSHEGFEALLSAQDGLCAVCCDSLTTPYVDHNHETGEVRGLLCLRCNTGIGHFRDNPLILAAAIQYLEGK